ncbi:hypothetical protein [Lacimicrobium alkaliphilum]|uniref:Alginate export domain-containing protein n=1 Tax=Lacimicrobium alkaliphilum TaxID=1526571 RepID=A0A0U2RM60_9ALTE|nr:hypothetical protein [Lacimicrobium alkaliphilum]ALS98346.1 hypothetical protein AT746_08825 [Lacimicrobium alkaliphilum]
MKNLKLPLAVAASLCLLSAETYAQQAQNAAEALQNAKVDLSLRYRSEWVDQKGIDENALANTLKTRFAYQSGAYQGLKLALEVDNVTSIGGETYNSTVNGNTNRPVVADPTSTEVNLATLSWQYQDINLSAGRHRINHDNQRFVGGVGWRQNEQTFDGYRIQYSSASALKLDYSYITNVNRIFSDKSPAGNLRGKLQLLNGQYQLAEGHQLSGFGYWLDFDQALALSTQTLGLSYRGQLAGLNLHAAYATQQDYADNLKDYSADYYQFELSGKLGQVGYTAGIETLGGDKGGVFITPLATLHKFQGFADKFLNTPAQGIEDIYLGVSSSFNDVTFNLTWHQFNSDRGDMDYGNEWDLSAAYKVNSTVGLLVKYARYQADEFATDTDKLWLMVSAKL